MEGRQKRSAMTISPVWLQVTILTFLIGFTTLGILAAMINRQHPPIPKQVVREDGSVLFTGDDVMAGQHIFQRYGLMQFGTIFGHGAYLGPDFTAQYLHGAATDAINFYQGQGQSPADARARVLTEFKQNRYDSAADRLIYSAGQVAAFDKQTDFYRDWFGPHERQTGLKRPHLSDPTEVRQLTAYFSWAAWVTAARRPGTTYSYTNNWPAEPLVANAPTAEAILWSALSLIALLGGAGLLFYFFGRYDFLGWRHSDEEIQGKDLQFRPPEEVRLSPSQRATAWYFLVVAVIFLAQGLLGGVNAHYHVEPAGFYGSNLSQLLPYNLSRMWHLQLALFFVATSFLAMGIFIVPMIARREPKHQDKFAITLFLAVAVVLFGSLAGEAASLLGIMSGKQPWFWIGAQGWEYLDLGRLWQILLTAGMFIWVIIMVRGMWSRLPGEHPGNLPYILLYSAVSIPLFYAAGMMFGKNSNFAVMDFWRFWVVHLWVEDFLELFTTIMVAYVFVLLGIVRTTIATRVVYLDIILYSIGGVIGTMHHVYFNGAPATHMALGAFFSAMEVIPLLLLTFEAWRFMRLGRGNGDKGVITTPAGEFPHKWALMFLIAVGFWNFLGAGIFGFLINLPIVSYYEVGTQFTANHGHAALMGVYGMLAIGFFIFVARYFIRPDRKSELAMKLSFWGLNIGLAWMVFVNLAPVGGMQLFDSVQNGYWHARQIEFFAQPAPRLFEWLRMPGDLVFIFVGIVPVVYLALRMFRERNRYAALPTEEETEEFVQFYRK